MSIFPHDFGWRVLYALIFSFNSQDYMGHGSQGLFTQVGFSDPLQDDATQSHFSVANANPLQSQVSVSSKLFIIRAIITEIERLWLFYWLILGTFISFLFWFTQHISFPLVNSVLFLQMNSLYSQPFAHYNTQPLNMQATQQQPQAQNSQNQKIHYNVWGTLGA